VRGNSSLLPQAYFKKLGLKATPTKMSLEKILPPILSFGFKSVSIHFHPFPASLSSSGLFSKYSGRGVYPYYVQDWLPLAIINNSRPPSTSLDLGSTTITTWASFNFP
jgi:hypothetical protein